MNRTGDLAMQDHITMAQVPGAAINGEATARAATAAALDKAARGMHSGADTVSRVGHGAADTIDAGAKYVRSHGARDMMADVEDFVKDHPAMCLIAAAAAGFLAGRALRKR
jgi:ElaB/YqjD/DUF883 family membrane-anchored ribosome-binding protein